MALDIRDQSNNFRSVILEVRFEVMEPGQVSSLRHKARV